MIATNKSLHFQIERKARRTWQAPNILGSGFWVEMSLINETEFLFKFVPKSEFGNKLKFVISDLDFYL